MADELLRKIRETPGIEDMLGMFDFDLYRVEYGPVEETQLPCGAPMQMIAGDAAGGAFMLVLHEDGRRPVVYLSSEGQGGLIATSLTDALALVVGLSSIHDACARPYGDELRNWLAECDAEIRADWPELDEQRALVRRALDLPNAAGLLESLHICAADESYRPVNEEGDSYESMLS